MRHSPDADTPAPLLVPVTVVSAESLPQNERLPPLNGASISALQTRTAATIESASQPPSTTAKAPHQPEPIAPQKPVQTTFNPYLLKSAQFNPAIFSSEKPQKNPVTQKEITTPDTTTGWSSASGGEIGQMSITAGGSSSGAAASMVGTGTNVSPTTRIDSMITDGKRKMIATYQASTPGTLTVVSVSGDGTTQTTILTNDHKTLAADIQKFGEMQK